jgi:NAD(P)-dependent dehydrogenase (short-subunit alcohol dehydrogenase family)
MGSISQSPDTGVVVTGGASGIGLASAEALAEAGRPVALWDLDGESARRAAALLGERHGVASLGLALDVCDTQRFPEAIRASRAALGSIGGLVHAAGVVRAEPVDELDEERWDAVLDVNLRAQALLVRALLSELKAQRGSAVVGIASIDAILGHAAIPAYCASKAGLLGLTRSLADRLAQDGIRVNAVCPGYVDTPMLAPALELPEQRAHLEAQALLGRLAEPREIRRAVRFLLSDDASFITAAELVVDGGVIRSQR